jgi:hypothetical protein
MPTTPCDSTRYWPKGTLLTKLRNTLMRANVAGAVCVAADQRRSETPLAGSRALAGSGDQLRSIDARPAANAGLVG